MTLGTRLESLAILRPEMHSQQLLVECQMLDPPRHESRTLRWLCKVNRLGIARAV